jgi:hypothetical protein
VPEKTSHTSNVVGVKVGDDQQRHSLDPQPVQAPIHDPRRRPGVNHNCCAAAGPHRESIALADIADNQNPIPWWPTRLPWHGT